MDIHKHTDVRQISDYPGRLEVGSGDSGSGKCRHQRPAGGRDMSGLRWDTHTDRCPSFGVSVGDNRPVDNDRYTWLDPSPGLV